MATEQRIGSAICRVVIVATLMIVMTACSGMKSFEPRNNREEGPEKGLFTGSQGEFVILRKDEADKEEQNGGTTDVTDE